MSATPVAAAFPMRMESLVSAGTITEARGEQYRQALTEAFTFKVNWDGSEETPAFAGV
ncbi:hypothetical protein SK803_09190 [Lentzea sp. BCCO 10_0856]|uniref:Uncharacterized protein n=1 Tax=Lentzea miocenica TaxID=3095431 RepID=A0ABU4SXB4_9PSEU|nr:hypothetical protein [Lentzea sp. BCCO 10_0856]MDX8030383.1 hypothetical protein [Lentzea sp. BCCO 10_0856]